MVRLSQKFEFLIYFLWNMWRCCIQDTLSSRAALGLPAAVQPLGRVRRASKSILHTSGVGASQHPHKPPMIMLDGRIIERLFRITPPTCYIQDTISSRVRCLSMCEQRLYTRYLSSRARLAECAREQRNLAYKSKGILHTTTHDVR